MNGNNNLYNYYKDIVKDHDFPLLILDLDKFNININEIKKRNTNEKQIRIASKSIRSINVLKRILESDEIFKGVLSYSGKEAIFLSQNGIKNIVVAYPVVNDKELNLITQSISNGADITLMVDDPLQIDKINWIAIQNKVSIPLCLDIDMSTTFPKIHFGVFRSPITSSIMTIKIAEKIKYLSNVTLKGIMGYEAQIAGVPDRSPSKNFLLNFIIRRLKIRSINSIAKRREMIVQALVKAGYHLDFVNAGGTGSIETSTKENVVTEITVGSGFYASHLFDYYDAFKHEPALFFGLEITRIPKEGIFTCHGGGYVASGSIGIDKIPQPYLPQGAQLHVNEMAGEVQTPVLYEGEMEIGDPIFMRHSKAGELCEHFNEIIVISDGKVIETVKTYRGDGQVFL